jgi:hypothetical protein
MKKGCLVAFVLLVALFLGLCGWWMFNGGAPSPRTYGYRLTLYVETPEGERIGSNVVQVKTRFYVGLQRALNSYSSVAVRGEATVVDLGSRGLLFIAFRGDTTRGGNDWLPYLQMVEFLFPRQKFRGTSSSDDYPAYLDELMRRKPKADLPLKELPMLVRFRDTNDPATVERVDPDNLDASFGPGVTLRRTTLEITDDPVSNGIVKQLPWLEKGYPETRLVSATGRPVSEVPPEQLLTHMDFRQVQQ